MTSPPTVTVSLWGYDISAETKLEFFIAHPSCKIHSVVIPDNRDSGITARMGDLCRSHEIPCFKPPALKNNDAFFTQFSKSSLDVIVVDSYSMLIPPRFLNVPRFGGFNFHPGKLPQYRGQHVMNWAIINGETNLTLTLHKMDASFDTGAVFLEQTIPIGFFDTINDVYMKVIHEGIPLCEKFIDTVLTSSINLTPQKNDHANYFRARTPEDGEIDWNKPAVDIHNFVRALTPPWPCAYFRYANHSVQVLSSLPVDFEDQSIRPGTILKNNHEELLVMTGKKAILVRTASPVPLDTVSLISI